MSESRKLGLVGKAIVALMVVVTAGLVVGAAVALRPRPMDAAHLKTRAIMTWVAQRARLIHVVGTHEWPGPLRSPPRTDRSGREAGDDDETPENIETGLAVLRRLFHGIEHQRGHGEIVKPGTPSSAPEGTLDPLSADERYRLDRFLRGYPTLLHDAWDHPIYYRCPGPVHKNGWDLIACGPNGVFENGEGDDIVVGEDLPGGLPPDSAPVTTGGK